MSTPPAPKLVLPEDEEEKKDKVHKSSRPKIRRAPSSSSKRTVFRNAANKGQMMVQKLISGLSPFKDGIPQNPIEKNQFRRPDDPKPVNNNDTRLVFIGTGTSGAVPHAYCFLQPTRSNYRCTTCNTQWSSAHDYKNKRANTSVVVRKRGDDGDWKTIVCDVGMVWKENALAVFKAHGLKEIDAVLLTHAHSDAANLAWLRDWVEDVKVEKFIELPEEEKEDDGGTTEQPGKKKSTFLEVGTPARKGLQRKPSFIVQDGGKCKIQDGVNIYASRNTRKKVKGITPWYIDSEAASGSHMVGKYNWPDDITDNNKNLDFKIGKIPIKGVDVHHGSDWDERGNRIPCRYTSWHIGKDEIIYLSDVSEIPENVKSHFVDKKPKVLVLDCLETQYQEGTSHLHLEKALFWAREINAKRTYLVGFMHSTSHEAYLDILEDREVCHGDSDKHTVHLEEVRKRIHEQDLLKRKDGKGKLDVRPAYDGLCVTISKEGKVVDDDDRMALGLL